MTSSSRKGEVVSARPRIDLNADLGESFGSWRTGDDVAMLNQVTSANIACGFHAGDPVTLRAATTAAAASGVVVGAHVAYHDLVGFGRRFLDASEAELSADVLYQLSALEGIAQVCGTQVSYVKPHGALYHACATYDPHARAVAEAVAEFSASVSRQLPLMLQPSESEQRQAGHFRAAEAGIPTVREVFADRRYHPDGTLVSRRDPAGVITDVAEAVEVAQRFVEEGVVLTTDGSRLPLQAQSICLHADTPDALVMAAAVREALERAGADIRSFA